MAYAQEHILLRFNGHFGGPTTVADRWSVGIRLGQASLPVILDSGKMQTLCNSAATAAAAFHATTGTFTGTNTYFDQVAGATIGPSGKYSPAGQLTVLSAYNPVAGSGTAALPWNSALVCSLRTAIPRGRGSNGRVYWPALALSVGPTTGRVSQASITSRLGAFKTFLDALNVAANTYFAGTRVIVASGVGLGVNAPVTSVRSDDRVDSIERRENDQPPAYVSVTLA